jgi:hypothetical protein
MGRNCRRRLDFLRRRPGCGRRRRRRQEINFFSVNDGDEAEVAVVGLRWLAGGRRQDGNEGGDFEIIFRGRQISLNGQPAGIFAQLSLFRLRFDADNADFVSFRRFLVNLMSKYSFIFFVIDASN